MRFTTVDPIRSGSNWYSYVSNDPINMIDPFGLSGQSDNPFQENIDKINNALEDLNNTEWANSSSGEQITETLEQLNSNNDIIITSEETLPDQLSQYRPDSDTILIRDDVPDDQIPSLLAHEGTHAQQQRDGKLVEYGFDDEREAFNNEYDVDQEIRPDETYNYSDDEIRDGYGFSDPNTGAVDRKDIDSGKCND